MFARCAPLAACLLPAAVTAAPLSVLEPAGPAAREAALLWWWMAGVALAVWGLVCGLWLRASRRPPPAAPAAQQSTGLRWIVAGGLLLPGAAVIALLAWGIPAGLRMALAGGDPPALQIDVTARQWQWDIRYPDSGRRLVDTLYLPAGQVVELRLGSEDVIHSFWIPRLGGKMDAVPGRIHRLRLQADAPGHLRGQCAEYCGIDHAFMRLEVHVLSREDFASWLKTDTR